MRSSSVSWQMMMGSSWAGTWATLLGLVQLLPIAVIIGFAVAGMLDAWWWVTPCQP